MIHKEEDNSVFEKQRYDDDLDIKKDLMKVHTARITKEITSDVVLAKFDNPKDKQYIIDMAYAGKFVIDKMTDELEGWIQYEKDNELGEYKEVKDKDGKKRFIWEGKIITEEQKDKILEVIDSTFGLFMDRIAILSALHRNVQGNKLVEMILESKGKEDEMGRPEEGVELVKKSIKNNLKNEEE